MQAKRLLGHIVALVILAGCTERSGDADAAAVDRAARLDGRRVVLVAMPRDDFNGLEHIVALRLAAAFAQHAKRVDMVPDVGDHAMLLQVARKDRAGYLALPVVSNWGARAGWLAPDQAGIGFAIVEVSSGQEIVSVPLVRSRPLLTFISAGTQTLSPRLIDAYVDGLY